MWFSLESTLIHYCTGAGTCCPGYHWISRKCWTSCWRQTRADVFRPRYSDTGREMAV